jgi:anti-anti-sigma factor
MSDLTLHMTDETEAADARPIEVLLAAQAFGYAAIVKLCGEHDLASADELTHVLDPIAGDVLVDLSECAFIDSTVITILVRDHQTRTHDGQRLELYVPTQNATVSRTLAVSGLADLIPIRHLHP